MVNFFVPMFANINGAVIPKYDLTFLFQRLKQRLQSLTVLGGITEKNVVHTDN
jgi:hypothetical protein